MSKPKHCSIAKSPDRAKLLKVISTHVRYLQGRGTEAAFHRLSAITELTGYINNLNTSTCPRLANGIIALSAVIDLDDLIQTAHGAAFYRHQHDRLGYARADKLADDALARAGVDVVAWNAEIAAEETGVAT